MTTSSISIPQSMINALEPQNVVVTWARSYSTENSKEKLAAFSIKQFFDGLQILNYTSPQVKELSSISNTFWQSFSFLEFPRHLIESLNHFYYLLNHDGKTSLDFFKSTFLACGTFCLAQDLLAKYKIIQPLFSDTKSLLLWRVYQGAASLFSILKNTELLSDFIKEAKDPVATNLDNSLLEPGHQYGFIKSGAYWSWVGKIGTTTAALATDVFYLLIGIIVSLGATIGFAVSTSAIFQLNSALITASVARNIFEQIVQENAITMSPSYKNNLKPLYMQISKV